MSKLRLSLEDLTVESFETGDGRSEKGTVHAHGGTAVCNTADITCDGERTCYGYATCGPVDTCQYRSCGLCGTNRCVGTASADGSCIDTCAYTCGECWYSHEEITPCIFC